MRKLVVRIHASQHEVELDDYLEPDEEIYYDNLYDYFIHEIITQPNYEYVVVDENGKEIKVER